MFPPESAQGSYEAAQSAVRSWSAAGDNIYIVSSLVEIGFLK